MSKETPDLDWSNNRLLPAFQPPQLLDVYDLRGASRDTQLTATIVAGLVNRPQIKVYLILGDEDNFWLEQAFGSVARKTSHQIGNAALDALLTTYHDTIQGLIIYDPALIDTINIATTLAGQRDGIVISPSQAQDLQKNHQFPTLVDLRTYQWHSRVQAYSWAQQNLLADSSSHLLAGLDPSSFAGLRSFLVSTRTFVYWLDSRKYLPDLSSGLLSERALMQQIIQSFPAGSSHLGWFIDESSGVSLTSQQAIPVLASDFFNNLEVWTAFRPTSAIAKPQPPAIPSAENKIYLSFTISDGDNLQFMQHRMARLWRDGARGSLPIGWTLSPVLLQVAPALADYYMRTATAHDELIAGPSGAGYMFPSHWPAEHLPAFLEQTGQLMQAMNMSILEVLDTVFWQSSGLPLVRDVRLTGMVFSDDDRQHSYAQALKPYGLQGILSGAGILLPKGKLVDGVPLYHNLGLAGSVNTAVKLIKGATLVHHQRPFFLNVYILAWSLLPSDLVEIVKQLGDGYEVVAPSTLLALLAKTL